MQINYNKEKLENMARDFYNATGASICVLDKNFSPLIDVSSHTDYCRQMHCSKKGKSNCLASDRALLTKTRQAKKRQMDICHGGLMDASAPIFYEGDIIGYIILGELKYQDCFSVKEDYIRSLGLDTEHMKALYDRIPLYSPEKIRSIAGIAATLSGYILLEKMLLPYTSNRGERIVAYIDENFCGELGIQKICEDINVSKNVLYRFIREKFGCTVSEYINRKRIAFAQGLLKGSDLSVEEISQKCGFSSTSYFTRTFKKQIGITPLKFKNHNDAKKDS